jgi:8-oxo-dGTP pyrophosphatase MutT (NUDIX family)
MKLLSVVFPTFAEGNTNLILMGRQAPGKRMPGIRNGFGGKCEAGEHIEDCAVREVKEEINLDIRKEDLYFVGTIVEGDKQVYFYTVRLGSKITIADNTEMVDCRWFDVEKQNAYIHEMLPDNERPMCELARSLRSPEEFTPFALDFSDNDALLAATANIFDKPDRT